EREEINISDLAKTAGVARGTVYNNLGSIDDLLERVTDYLTEEMNLNLEKQFQSVSDPAKRVSYGIRLYVYRAKNEPLWGEFLCRFGMESASLQALITGPMGKDIQRGLEEKRFQFREEQFKTVIALIGSSVLTAFYLVKEGISTWTEAGADCAEFALRSLGIDQAEAAKIGSEKIPSIR
ncbi:MAG TPA: TetR/AcrR family transcriptional regulator, partial [Leptospiraceae bacterium]|nr:TetR/AcrR family transcriptional regulator [Leptospiraceae bacterium]